MSSSDIAVSIRGLSKSYTIAREQERTTRLTEAIMESFRRPFRRARKDTFWALKDVALEIRKGDMVGIIGRNGAGKSTLLKILSRITEPTTGAIEIYGRTGSLLEVGTGFHAELTGRENIYLNGSILGMRRREIDRYFDEIVDFAGVEQFLDTPVKRYSSGMYVRLAFAVAAHLNPDILVIDEVLAVGDAMFQRKCLGKMSDVSRNGKTVIFVSHQMQTISTLARKCFVLDKGALVFAGPTERAIREYTARNQVGSGAYEAAPTGDAPTITRVEIVTSEDGQVQVSGQPMAVRIEIYTPFPVRGARMSFQICNAHQQPIAHLWMYDSERPILRQAGLHSFMCEIPVCRLYMGEYSVTVHLSEYAGGEKYATLEGVCPFEVAMYGAEREGVWYPGTCAYVECGSWSVTEDCADLPPTSVNDMSLALK